MLGTSHWRFAVFALLGSIACATSGVETASAQAAKEPPGPIEITSGTSAGGTPDLLMRRAAKILADEGIVKQPIVVQNRTGASWMNAANFVLGKAGDQQTILTIAQPILTTPITTGQATVYDKLTPIAMFVQGDLVVAVQPNSPVSDLKGLVELAKKRDRSVKVAGAQAGSTDHMVVGLIEKAGGVKLNYIPFDGGGTATAAFLGGNVDVITLTPSELLPLMKGGKAKPVAILSEKRRPEAEFKDVPTAKEQGLDVIWGQSWGLAGPPNMDPALVKFWQAAIAKLVNSPAWQDSLKENFQRSAYDPASDQKAELKRLHDEHLALLRELGQAKM
jgi:putative tricarboxylic transport membrane protein